MDYEEISAVLVMCFIIVAFATPVVLAIKFLCGI